MEQEKNQKPPKRKLTVTAMQAMYADLMDIPFDERDRLAARAIRIMARRGECKLFHPIRMKLTADEDEIHEILGGLIVISKDFDNDNIDNDNETDS